MLDHQDGHALVAEVFQDAEGLLHQQRREADGGFVDQDQLGVEQQPAHDFELLLLPAREGGGLHIGLLPECGEAIERGFDALFHVGDMRPGRDRAEFEVMAHG